MLQFIILGSQTLKNIENQPPQHCAFKGECIENVAKENCNVDVNSAKCWAYQKMTPATIDQHFFVFMESESSEITDFRNFLQQFGESLHRFLYVQVIEAKFVNVILPLPKGNCPSLHFHQTQVVNEFAKLLKSQGFGIINVYQNLTSRAKMPKYLFGRRDRRLSKFRNYSQNVKSTIHQLIGRRMGELKMPKDNPLFTEMHILNL